MQGVERTCIFDFQRNRLLQIPNLFIEAVRSNTVELVDPIVDYLCEEGLGERSASSGEVRFSDRNWQSAEILSNAVIEYTGKDELFSKTLEFVLRSRVKAVQVLIKNGLNLDLNKFQSLIKESPCKQIELVHFGGSTSEFGFLLDVCMIYSLVGNDANKIGFVESRNNIIASREHFVEARFRSTYFNQKIYVDGVGDIYNSPETNTIHGNIDETTFSEFREIVNGGIFQKLWGVNKDKIKGCQDCDLRYCCIDDRVPIQASNGDWFYETDCHYDPYSKDFSD